MSTPAIRTADLCYDYHDGKRALSSLSFTLAPGDSVGVIGPNGAGKTTLLHVLAGLLSPTSGLVEVFDQPYGTKTDRDVRQQIGYVFQESEDQLFNATVRDEVAFGPIQFGLESIDSRVANALSRVGLAGAEEKVPQHLSSGERRRVALASVLAYEPKVLLLDEPTSDLDPRGRKELVQLLRASDEAKIIASHDLEFVLRCCEQVLLLDDGGIVEQRSVVDCLTDRGLLLRHGLDTPLGLRGLSAEALTKLLAEEESESEAQGPTEQAQSSERN